MGAPRAPRCWASLRLRGRSDKPSMAVILDRCQLCLEGAGRAERRELRKRSAVILLPSLRLRCDGDCAAGASAAEVDARPVGLPWNEWRREFSGLAEITTPVAEGASGSSDDALREAIAKITAAGRFFAIENATVFVSSLRSEPVRVSEKGAFPAVVVEIVGVAQRSTKFKDILPAVIDHAHRNAERAIAEFITGRGRDGTLLVHFGAGVLRGSTATATCAP